MTPIQWFYSFLRQYKWKMFWGLVLVTILAIASLVNPYISGMIVDDVISTGDSLRALQQLVKSAGGEIVGNAAPLAEGDAAERKDLIYLEQLPLFFKD